MNASEARSKVMEAKTQKSTAQYNAIKKEIERQVEANKLFFYWPSSIDDPVRQKLIGEGFTIGKTDGGGFRNEQSTEIAW